MLLVECVAPEGEAPGYRDFGPPLVVDLGEGLDEHGAVRSNRDDTAALDHTWTYIWRESTRWKDLSKKQGADRLVAWIWNLLQQPIPRRKGEERNHARVVLKALAVPEK